MATTCDIWDTFPYHTMRHFRDLFKKLYVLNGCLSICSIYILVGGAITILKNMKVNGKDYPIYEMENKTCSKPPTSIYNIYLWVCKKIGYPKISWPSCKPSWPN